MRRTPGLDAARFARRLRDLREASQPGAVARFGSTLRKWTRTGAQIAREEAAMETLLAEAYDLSDDERALVRAG